MMRRLYLLALPLLAFSATLATSPLQQPALPDDKSVPASKIELKNLAPVSKDVLNVKLPESQRDDSFERPHCSYHRRSSAASRLPSAQHERGRLDI